MSENPTNFMNDFTDTASNKDPVAIIAIIAAVIFAAIGFACLAAFFLLKKRESESAAKELIEKKDNYIKLFNKVFFTTENLNNIVYDTGTQNYTLHFTELINTKSEFFRSLESKAGMNLKKIMPILDKVGSNTPLLEKEFNILFSELNDINKKFELIEAEQQNSLMKKNLIISKP